MPRSTCGACNKIFSSTGAFDAHRVGSFGEAVYKSDKDRLARHASGRTAHTRRCMTTEEMLDIGTFAVERKTIQVTHEGVSVPEEHDIWYEPEAREALKRAYQSSEDDE